VSAVSASPAAKGSPVTGDPVRALQHALYRAAKADPGRRFHTLYDKIRRRDVLWRAWVAVRRNNGAPGIDKITLAGVEEYGVDRLLGELANADRQGDRRVDVQRGPDSRQRRDQAEPGPRRDSDPAGPDLSGRRGSQDKQGPGPDRGPRTSSGGPVRTRQADRSPLRRGPAGRLGSQDRCTGSAGPHGLGQGSHDHSQSVVASG
jgi:hypothetical protein